MEKTNESNKEKTPWQLGFDDGISDKPMAQHDLAYVNGHNTGREIGVNCYRIDPNRRRVK